MTLPETHRQLVAGGAAALVFLALYFGATLKALVAGGLAALVFIALLVLIRRTPPPDTVFVADGVTAADLDAATRAIAAAAARLAAAARTAPESNVAAFSRMADILARISAHHARDPRDLRHTRRFLRHDLPRLVETSESFVDLSSRAGPADAARLAALAERIQGFVPALERIDRACLENDFHALEVEVDVLSGQLSNR